MEQHGKHEIGVRYETPRQASVIRQLPAPRWAGPGARRYVHQIGRARLAWVEAGSGPPLILLHGYAGSARWWVRNLAPLARAHTVYALDLPGFGSSRTPDRYSFPASIGLLAAWMDLHGVARADLAGHSMGGQLAILFAAAQPRRVRRLVLLAPAGLPSAASLLGIARRALASRVGGDYRFTPIVIAGAVRAGPRILWQAVQQIRRVDVRPHLAAIALPTLVLWGTADRLLAVSGAGILADAIAGAEVRLVPGANHNVFFEQADLVNDAMLSFLGHPGKVGAAADW